MKKPKIFIGLNDIASTFNDYKRAFQLLGYTVYCGVRQPKESPLISSPQYDFSLFPHTKKTVLGKMERAFAKRNKIHRKKRLHSMIKECDLFVFVYDTFYDDHSDLEVISKANKKIIIIFVGDDARWSLGMEQDFTQHHLQPVPYPNRSFYTATALKARLRRIRMAEKYADFIFSKREQAQLQLRPFFHYPMNIFLGDFEERPIQKQNPIIVHAPSNPTIKGTNYVINAVERLKSNNDFGFTFKLIQNLSHREALKVYAESDIIIDQLFLPGGGKLSSEGLALGKVVLTNMSYSDYPQGFHSSDCPVVHVDTNNIYETLNELIPNIDKRQSIANRGRPYAEKKLDVIKFCEKLLDLFYSKDLDFDYQPSFFRRLYQPDPKSTINLLNKWTHFVKDCNWYHKYVDQGTRAGLKF